MLLQKNFRKGLVFRRIIWVTVSWVDLERFMEAVRMVLT